MAEADLGKIIDLIMKNPDLIAQIKELSAKNEASEDAEVTTDQETASEKSDTEVTASNSPPVDRVATTAPTAKHSEIFRIFRVTVGLTEKHIAIKSNLGLLQFLDYIIEVLVYQGCIVLVHGGVYIKIK